MLSEPLTNTATVEKSSERLPERRKRQRLAAQWPMQLWRGSEHASGACTANISSEGVYCVLPQPLSPGEGFIALLEIPGRATDRESGKLTLRCDVCVLRADALNHASNWGVAFRIVNYSVLHIATAPASANGNADTDKCPSFIGGGPLPSKKLEVFS